MPSFGNVALFPDSGPAAGAIFMLAKPADTSRTVVIDGTVEVVLVEGSAAIVVRNVVASSYEVLLSTAPERANRALDLIAIRGGQRAVLTPIDSSHVAWWVTPDGKVVLRWYEGSDMNFAMSVTAEVRDAAGNVVPQPAQPEPQWHESMRYFRASQTTDDVYDSFRNIYLALEAVLSTLEPVQLNAKGNPEGERVWVDRALGAAAKVVNLNTYLSTPALDPADAVREELYSKIRTSIFHAKNGRPALLPQDQAHRAVVLDALERYTRLYLDLCSAALGVSFGGGGMTAAGFGLMTNALVDLQAWVTCDPTSATKEDQDLTPTGAPRFPLKTGRRSDLEEPMRFVAVGHGVATDVTTAIGQVRRAGGLGPEGQLMQVSHLEQDLNLAGVDVFEYAFAVRGVNAQQPKSRFAT